MRARDVVKELQVLGSPRGEGVGLVFQDRQGPVWLWRRFLRPLRPRATYHCEEVSRASALGDRDALEEYKVHECRLTVLLILVEQYSRGTERDRGAIARFYLAHTKCINNWDLVDLSVPRILGDYLMNRDHKILYKLAKSKDLWERRISVLATFAFIREGNFKDALAIAEMHLGDTHDLMHKAVGWMLREVGKRSKEVEVVFFRSARTPYAPHRPALRARALPRKRAAVFFEEARLKNVDVIRKPPIRTASSVGAGASFFSL